MDVCDVVVVGGGIAGASVAYELAATRSVTLLEAEPELARHSTARSAATWIPGHGDDVVRALIAASGPRFARLAEELDAPPLLRPLDVLWTAGDDASEAGLATMLAERAGEPDAPVALDPGRGRGARCPRCGRGGSAPPRARWRRPSTPTRCTRPTSAASRPGAAPCGRRPRPSASPATARAGGWGTSPPAWSSTRPGRGPTSSPNARACPGSACSPTAGRSPSPGCPTARGCAAPWCCEALDRFYYKIEGDDLLVSPADETPVGARRRPSRRAGRRPRAGAGRGGHRARPAVDPHELGGPALVRARPPPGRRELARPPRLRVRRRPGRVGHRDRARARRLRRRRADGRAAARGRARRTGRAGSYSPVGSRG